MNAGKIALVLTCFSIIPSLVRAGHCTLENTLPVRVAETIDEVATLHGTRSVKIYGVDVGDGRGVPLHAGPLEVFDQVGLSVCRAELELPTSPFMFAGNRYFYFRVGDAIDVAIYVLDLDTCKVVWRSRSYEWDRPPKITANALLIAGKSIKLKDDCLPGIASPVKPPP